MLVDLNLCEYEWIRIIRNFDFLRSLHYDITEMSWCSTEYPLVILDGKIRYRRRVHINGGLIYPEKDAEYSIAIERFVWNPFISFKKSNFRSWIFNINECYDYFDCGLVSGQSYPIEVQADFIKKYLMPVIKGEMWIDELVKKNQK